MSRLIEPFNERARAIAGFAQPVIVALGTAGLTGGAMAAMGLVADHAWRRHKLHVN
ncbi:hypothetical protein V474_05190 [Novosphingobium barchaimii LL02]|uniref:Uncharacterized protein n=1 Tax=Novosphingobium barchaimii LL02 TaxID=1114963 RepID=A0A0J8A6X7_9SPHN|nr:hypothetical protein [Novosphingobium barchaimii]KMS51150.1 hypothetical protein V474_05190 [Novosphingobium barchaimii LL02]